MNVTTKARPTSVAGPRTTEVFADNRYLGLVFPSNDRWVGGWAVVPTGYDAQEDQPTKRDAIASLVAFMTSPFRDRDDKRLMRAIELVDQWAHETGEWLPSQEQSRALAQSILDLTKETQ